jgi:CDP-diglyceride synthetase
MEPDSRPGWFGRLAVFIALSAVLVLVLTSYSLLCLAVGVFISICTFEFHGLPLGPKLPFARSMNPVLLHLTLSWIAYSGAVWKQLPGLMCAFFTVTLLLILHEMNLSFSHALTPSPERFLELCARIAGHLYVDVLFSHAWLLAVAFEYGRQLLVFTLVVVVVGENGGLVGGLALGRTKLAPLISPNKTWAGFWSQVLSGALAAVLFVPLQHVVGVTPRMPFSTLERLVLGVLLSLAGVVGDLAESYGKRAFGRKDMSHLMPTGGMLDRVDGILFALPTMYYWTVGRFGHAL